MDTAFQAGAFQGDAFQIAAPAPVVATGGVPLWMQLFKQQRAIIDEEEEILVMAMML